MASWIVRVRPGGCVSVQSQNRVYKAGELIDTSTLKDQKAVEDWIKNGYVEPVNALSAEPKADVPTDNPPGTDRMPALPVGELLADQAVTTKPIEAHSVTSKPLVVSTLVETPSGVSQSVTTNKVQQAKSIWDLNPADLEGKSLDELNVMVLERNSDEQPFDTEVEARAFLSQDFMALGGGPEARVEDETTEANGERAE